MIPKLPTAKSEESKILVESPHTTPLKNQRPNITKKFEGLVEANQRIIELESADEEAKK